MIYPYKNGSASAKALAQALGIKRIKREGSKFKGKVNKVVINWGSSTVSDEVAKCLILNEPEAVAKAANKLTAFNAMAEVGVTVPRFTTDADVASDWGTDIVVRHKLNGHSGEGIEIVTTDDDLPAAPLYVEYIKKKHEYRYHVGRTIDHAGDLVKLPSVIDVQRKARKKDVPDDQVNWQVRNHQNGFIYAREGVEVSPIAANLACTALAALGLDFGAVDLIYNEKSGKWYVLEVNTACGLEGTTLEKYAEFFGAWV